jgi:hypothetical protein
MYLLPLLPPPVKIKKCNKILQGEGKKRLHARSTIN